MQTRLFGVGTTIWRVCNLISISYGESSTAPKYLDELQKLTGNKIDSDSLLPVDDTAKLVEDSKLHEKSICFQIYFEDKECKRFNNYISKIYEVAPGPIYIWTHRTNICGACQVESILKFNFSFDFDVSDEGVIVLLAKDLKNKLLLDFSMEKGRKILDVEVTGRAWSGVRY